MAKEKYDPDTFPFLAEKYAREGCIDKTIAQKLGISKDTFYEYQKKYSDFSDSIKRGKKPVDFEVEKTLLKRALGYEYEETEIEADALTNVVTKTKKKIKQMPPNVAAALRWLYNRKPEKWRPRTGDLPTGTMQPITGFNYIVPQEPKKKKK